MYHDYRIDDYYDCFCVDYGFVDYGVGYDVGRGGDYGGCFFFARFWIVGG